MRLENRIASVHMDNYSHEIDLLIETSWEVCNKIGGIYTVLSSKAKTLKNKFKDKLIFIGPDVWTKENPSPFFSESRTLLRRWLADAHLPEGVGVRVGRWNIPGKPIAVLVRFDGMYASKNEAYGRMWELFHVDSLHAYGDYDEGCAFARAAAAVIESLVRHSGADHRKVIAHFDEWTTAMGLLTIRADMPDIATVFTTHATSIGRSICGNGKPLYDQLPNYNGDQMARELNMESKHSLEKAAALNADCFTTVSDVTASEASQLLGRTPDEITPNGFEPDLVPARTRYAAARKTARTAMLRVASALTGLQYPEDTFIIATSGRLEYRNKGLDVFLDAIAAVGSRHLPHRVLAFVMVPAWCGGPRQDLQHELATDSRQRISDPVLTHTLNNYSEDPVNRRIHEIGFTNDANAAADLIYVPCYLNGNDGIFNLSYYQLLPGMDATVFASYYEPWGYTPLESVAFGVPTITTTLAGFGAWILGQWQCGGFGKCGTDVITRTDSNRQEAVEAIASDICTLVNASADDKASFRAKAAGTASMADWSNFIVHYDHAYQIASENRDKRLSGSHK